MQSTLAYTGGSIDMIDMHSSTAQAMETRFDHRWFYGYLSPDVSLGEVLLSANQLQSTQTLLQDNTAVIPDGTVCTAFQQVGGKGANDYSCSLPPEPVGYI